MKILLDTNVFVAAKNKSEPAYSESIRLIELIDRGRIKCVVPALVIAELCAGYYQEEDEEGARELLEAFLTTPSYEIIPIDHKIACEAGRVRAELRLKLPDAIIIATAVIVKADAIITYDQEIRKAEKYITIKTPREIT